MSKELTREEVRDILRAYPNLEAIVIGCVSGHHTEWPMVRLELQSLVSSQRATIQQLEAKLADLQGEA